MTATLDPMRGVAEAMLRQLAQTTSHTNHWATPGDLAKALDASIRQTPALDLIDDELVRLANTPDARLIISLAPQEGKSSRVAEIFPAWALQRNPDLRIVVASYGMALARRNGRAIRNRILTNADLLGLRIADDLAAQHEWQLAGHRGGVYAAGIGTALTGRPCDLMVIDDPVKDRSEADSATYRQNVWDWWTDVASTRLAPGAPVCLILCMAGDTPVLLPDGTEKPLRDVRPGDEVATYEGGGLTTSTVMNWANQGLDDLLRIRMKSGRAVRANARHPFLTIDANGEESWLRTDQIQPGVRILTATGGNGAGSPAPLTNVTRQRAARGCVTPTTARLVGHPATARPRSTLRRVAELASSIVTGSPMKRLTSSSTSRAGTVPSADSRRRTATPEPTGTGSCASTTTTTPERCADCSATTATSPSDTGSHPQSSGLPLTTWSVTPDEVVAVEPCGREDVFDLQIARTENFIANGLVSHNTRWHEDDLAGRLQAAEDGHLWRVVNIPAQADHRPEEGESDPLSRDPGEYLESARGRTLAQWDAIKIRAGSRTWNALYQGRPSPAEGGIFHRAWWGEYDSPRWVVQGDGTHWAVNPDEVAMSWDMAFKDTSSSDYVVGQVWGRWGVEVFLLDQIHERLSFVETCAALRQLAAKWPQATAKYIEDKANGTAVINSLSKTVHGLIPVEPDGSKEARAAAVSPFVESGAVHLPAPELAPWIGGFVDEHAAFPQGSHDDQVDATSQALNRLLLNPILTGGLVVEAADFDDGFDDRPISIY